MKRALLFLCIGWTLALAQGTWQEKAQQGRAALRAKNFDEAIADLDQALGLAPADQTKVLAILQFYKAQALEGRGDILQALQCAKIAIRYTPDDPKLTEFLTSLEAKSVDQVASSRDISRSLEVAKGFPPTANEPAAGGGTNPAPPNPGTVDLHINFEFNRDTLDAKGKEQTAQLAAALKAPEIAQAHIVLIGHTDLKGEPDYNQKLSVRRANTVLKALTTEFGIEPSRVQAEGHGMREPLVNQKTDQAGAINRRVAIQVAQ